MRHRVMAALLSVGLAAAVLTGCETKRSDHADVRVSGEAGVRPTVGHEGNPPRAPQVDVVRSGSGKTVEADEIVIADIDIRVWEGNREYLSTWTGGHPNSVIMDGTHVSRSWDTSLIGKKAGSRVVLTAPASVGFGPNLLPPTGTKASDTLIVVFDILGSYAKDAAAQGEKAEQGAGAPGLPTVEFDSAGVPKLSFPDAAAPKEPAAATLLTGKGEKVAPTDTVVVQFSHQPWGSPTPDQTSYNPRAPRSFNLDGEGVPAGWKQFVAGATVGSRLVVAEPGAGKDAADGGGAYVIDIIDVIRPAAQ
ncbi:FKBP-type peptidyl-prolyl cis-trans isomerase [Streptomyces sp. IBSNAI002]|uniref:FKBP-type peptidyl-prolyl cis-trans isomerase n=1 Tax=Streptomyces sp. IBSNAI002 TaxID=3457500 RepID=UPI003FD2A914